MTTLFQDILQIKDHYLLNWVWRFCRLI